MSCVSKPRNCCDILKKQQTKKYAGDEATIATSEDVSSVRLRASQSRQQEQLTCFHFWMKAIYSFAVRTFVTRYVENILHTMYVCTTT